MPSRNGVTPADQWGPQAEVVELPSGAKARLRGKLNVWTLVRRGALTPELLEAYNKAERGELTDLDQAVELNDLILQEMFVEPKVFLPSDEETDPPRGHVHVDRIDDLDVTFVLERAFGGARDAARFRGDPDGPGSSDDGAYVGDDPEQSDGAGAGKPAGVSARPNARRKASGNGRKSAKRKPAAAKK